MIVDTPGIFDTKESNDDIQKEIAKCISLSSPGPHAFVLVLNIARYTEEEEKSVQHFVNYFGEKIFKYFIILFTRKDDLDEEGKCLNDHIKSVPANLKIFIEKCGSRVIAFNNRLKGEEGDAQVKELLAVIFDNLEKNNGEYYRNEMYIEAEKILQEKEAELRRKAQIQRDNELKAVRDEMAKEFSREAEKHKSKTALEYQKWRKKTLIKQEKEFEVMKEKMQEEYLQEIKKARDASREEIEKGGGVLNTVWSCAKLILPGVFTTLNL